MILKLLKELQEKFKMSIIISHNLSILASFCDRILVMYDGEIVEIGPAMSLIKHPCHTYTQELIA